MSDTVLYEAADAVATITLNRPERLNAMTSELLETLAERLEEAAADDAIRVVVVTGAGRGFCAGGDLAAMAEDFFADPDRAAQVAGLRGHMRCSELLREMPKVTIAAVNGACAGAGLSLACAADLRIAAASAVFRTAFVRAGVSGDFGGTWLLPRLIGAGRARELYLRNTRVGATEAVRIGLAAEAVDDPAFAERVRAVARELAAGPPLALAAIKANLDDGDVLPFSEALDREAGRHVDCARSADATEAGMAFFEKRAPAFQGR